MHRFLINAAVRIIVCRLALMTFICPVIVGSKDAGYQRFPAQCSTLYVRQDIARDRNTRAKSEDEDEEAYPQLAQAGWVSHIYGRWRRISGSMWLSDVR